MEQLLIEDLIIESIGIYGHTIFYCPRTIIDKDDVYGEDPISEYNGHFQTDAYIRSFDSYEGDGTFLSKFNLEIRDQMTFTMARRTFEIDITSNESSLVRPREGDLIYSSMTGKIMVIKYVSNTPIFYQMGSLQVWDLVCEIWEYSSEKLNTGVPDIDVMQNKYSIDEEQFGVLTNAGFNITDQSGNNLTQGQFDYELQNEDVFADNFEIEFEDERDNIVDWSDRDPFSSDL
jgi:hypothetical protein